MAGDVRTDGVPGGAALPPAGKPLAGQAGGARPLAQTLVPGTVLSGRVVQGLGQDLYLLALRGRTLVAQSSLPLTPDTMVRVQVMGAGDQLSLRLLDERGADHATTSDAPARAQVLGLPTAGAAQAVLAAFEDAGAPLDRELLRVAIGAVTAAGAQAAVEEDPLPQSTGAAPTPITSSAALLRAATPAALARAYATVARSGLPATPATLALALRATATPLPNPAAALGVALAAGAAAAGAAPAQMAEQPTPPSAPLPDGPPLLAAPTSGSRTAASAPLAGAGDPTTTASAAPAQTSTPGAAPARTLPTAADALQTPARAAATAGALEPATDSSAPPPRRPALSAPGTAAASTATPRDAHAPLAPAALAARLVPAATLRVASVPDAVREGVAGVIRALSLAGVRSAIGSGGLPITTDAATATAPVADLPLTAPAPLLRQLAAALPRPVSENAASDASDAVSGRSAEPVTTTANALAGALIHTAHEQAAQTVFKPDALADYRLVLSLPLQADGQPTPARLAIGERPGPDGTTTYLRVDTELSDLGTISVRLSGIDGGPLTITLVGHEAGSRALTESLPALVGSLRDLGLTAGVRVVDGEPD